MSTKAQSIWRPYPFKHLQIRAQIPQVLPPYLLTAALPSDAGAQKAQSVQT
jgi:hypothetical protein